MRYFLPDRMQVNQNALAARRRDDIGWGRDPSTATLMMHRLPRVITDPKGGI